MPLATRDLPLPTTPQRDALIDYATSLGLRIIWRELRMHQALYVAEHRMIILSLWLTERQEVSLIAHEIGHAHYGDDRPCGTEGESRAWRHAARLLVSPERYAAAEDAVGCDDHEALGTSLGVCAEVVEAWQEEANAGRAWTQAS